MNYRVASLQKRLIRRWKITNQLETVITKNGEVLFPSANWKHDFSRLSYYVLLDKIGHYDYILNVLVNHKIFFGWLIPLGTVDKYRTRPIADSKPFYCTTFVWKSQLYMTMIWTFLGSRHSLDSYNLCRASDIAAEGSIIKVFSMTKCDPNSFFHF